jgi:hypothetical protein
VEWFVAPGALCVFIDESNKSLLDLQDQEGGGGMEEESSRHLLFATTPEGP